MNSTTEKQLLEAVEKSILGDNVDVPDIDDATGGDCISIKKRNAVIIYHDRNGYYVKSGYNFHHDFDYDRGNPVAEGYTVEEALRAWLLNPNI